MAISFELPDLEPILRDGYDIDLSLAARDAFLADAYRTGRLSLGRLAAFLGLTSAQAMEWLDRHGVGPNYTAPDLDADAGRLAAIRRPG